MHRAARLLVPNDRGLALIGHTDCGEIGGLKAALVQCALYDRFGIRPDFERVMFHPTRLRVDLRELALVGGNEPAL